VCIAVVLRYFQNKWKMGMIAPCSYFESISLDCTLHASQTQSSKNMRTLQICLFFTQGANLTIDDSVASLQTLGSHIANPRPKGTKICNILVVRSDSNFTITISRY
jgi:hypothetical protein